MDKNTPVSSVMTKKVIVADLKSKFTDVQKLFLDYQIYHLPVVYDDKLLGIISVKDALLTYSEKVSSLKEGNSAEINQIFDLESIMTHKPNTVHPDTTLGEVVKILAEANYRSLPVVDDNGYIKGIISNKDLVRVFNKMI